ncbi:hypothetical protein JZ751_021630, partial [Albula glossodonta]
WHVVALDSFGSFPGAVTYKSVRKGSLYQRRETPTTSLRLNPEPGCTLRQREERADGVGTVRYVADSPSEQRVLVSMLLLLLLPVAALSDPVKFLPLDCEDIYNNGSIHSGVYTIFPAGHASPVQVYCDMG